MKTLSLFLILCVSIVFAQSSEQSFKIDEQNIELSGNLRFDARLINSTGVSSQQEELYLAQKKSPFLAGLMSAAIPGAGEIYAGNYWKAAIFMAIEAACITTNIIYNKKADEKTVEFQEFADANWSVVRYAEWLNNYASSLGAGEGARIHIDPDQSKAPWERVNFNEVNAVEEQVKTFSHKLVPYGEQQYYELIGKYHQYNHGWADSDPATSEYFSNLTPMFHKYADMHIEPDKIYQVASTAIVILVTNHILSALDAAWTTSRYNKHLKASMSISETNYLGNIIYYPELSLRLNF